MPTPTPAPRPVPTPTPCASAYAYAYARAYACAYACAYAYPRADAYAYAHACTYTYAYAYACACVYAYAYACAYACAYAFAFACAYSSIHLQSPRPTPRLRSVTIIHLRLLSVAATVHTCLVPCGFASVICNFTFNNKPVPQFGAYVPHRAHSPGPGLSPGCPVPRTQAQGGPVLWASS